LFFLADDFGASCFWCPFRVHFSPHLPSFTFFEDVRVTRCFVISLSPKCRSPLFLLLFFSCFGTRVYKGSAFGRPPHTPTRMRFFFTRLKSLFCFFFIAIPLSVRDPPIIVLFSPYSSLFCRPFSCSNYLSFIEMGPGSDVRGASWGGFCRFNVFLGFLTTPITLGTVAMSVSVLWFSRVLPGAPCSSFLTVRLFHVPECAHSADTSLSCPLLLPFLLGQTRAFEVFDPAHFLPFFAGSMGEMFDGPPLAPEVFVLPERV